MIQIIVGKAFFIYGIQCSYILEIVHSMKACFRGGCNPFRETFSHIEQRLGRRHTFASHSNALHSNTYILTVSVRLLCFIILHLISRKAAIWLHLPTNQRYAVRARGFRRIPTTAGRRYIRVHSSTQRRKVNYIHLLHVTKTIKTYYIWQKLHKLITCGKNYPDIFMWQKLQLTYYM